MDSNQNGLKELRIHKLASGIGTTLKFNRSSRYTTGLVCTYADRPERSFFFELDQEHREFYQDVCNLYELEGLDWIVHRTGGGGFHFISPTMISKEHWKAMHLELHEINKDCPMTTLRIEPNKYPNEDLVWYNSHTEVMNAPTEKNNLQMCNLLNKIFGSKFVGTGAGEIKTVKYPLPLREGEIPL